MKDNILKDKKILTIIILFIITAISLTIFSFIRNNQEETIITSISFMPEATNVYIDGQYVGNNVEIPLTIGTHEVKAELQSYETYTTTAQISKYSHNIFGYLLTKNQDTNTVIDNSMDGFLDEKYRQEDEIIAGIYPIYPYLPYNSTLPFTIDYSLSNDYTQFKIIITPHNNIFSTINLACKKLLYIKGDSTLTSIHDYEIKIKDYNQEIHFEDNQEESPYQYIVKGLKNNTNISVLSQEQEGDYYYAAISVQNPNITTDYVINKLIIKKENGHWNLVSDIYPLITRFNSNNIPSDILEKTNLLLYTENEDGDMEKERVSDEERNY